MIEDMDTGTMVAPHVRRVTVRGRTVHIIDMTTRTGSNTEHYDNFADPAAVETLRRLLRRMKNLKPLPRRRIPWTSSQVWTHPLVHPDFPYCRGELAANARTLRWRVKAKPARAEPKR